MYFPVYIHVGQNLYMDENTKAYQKLWRAVLDAMLEELLGVGYSIEVNRTQNMFLTRSKDVSLIVDYAGYLLFARNRQAAAFDPFQTLVQLAANGRFEPVAAIASG